MRACASSVWNAWGAGGRRFKSSRSDHSPAFSGDFGVAEWLGKCVENALAVAKKLKTTPDGRRIPAYCHHKPSGRAYVRINGEHIPLGDYDPSEGSPSMERYRRLIAEWRSSGYRTPGLEAVGPNGAERVATVRELTAWFLTWAEENYSRSEFLLCRQAMKALCELYGTVSVCEVGVAELRTVREQLARVPDPGDEAKARRPLGRKTVNALLGRMQRAFKYAASEGQIPPEAAVNASVLKPLKRGRTSAPDYAVREPACREDVDKVLPYLTPQVRAIVETLWHTGARIGEVVQLRSIDVDMSGEVWVFTPTQHKTKHHGHQRAVLLGPRAQEFVAPFIKDDPETFWFDPLEESRTRSELWHDTPKGDRSRNGVRCARPGAVRREALDPRKVQNWLRQACSKVGVKFTSHQLRHAALSRIRAEHGIESARLIAGQHSQIVTRGYTRSIELAKASEVAKVSG